MLTVVHVSDKSVDRDLVILLLTQAVALVNMCDSTALCSVCCLLCLQSAFLVWSVDSLGIFEYLSYISFQKLFTT